MSKWRKLSLPAAAGLAVILAAVLTVLLCLPGAALIAKSALPMEAAPIWGACAAGAGILISVAAAAQVRRRQTLPLAGATAAGILLLAVVLCAAGGERTDFGPWLWRLAAAAAGGGLAGAFLSVRQNPHRKRRR